MNLHAGSRRTSCQRLYLADLVDEPGADRVVRNALGGDGMHLVQVWPVSQPPRAGQLLPFLGEEVVQPMARLRPSQQALVQLNLVWPCRADQDGQVARPD